MNATLLSTRGPEFKAAEEIEEVVRRTDGLIRTMPADFWYKFSPHARAIWGHLTGTYGFPTTELVEWLLKFFDGKSAIEIGAGGGAFHGLGIPMTDSWLQEKNEMVRAYYDAAGQPRIPYPPCVEELDAAAAVEKYKPQVVFGSWITHWIDPTLPPQEGSVYGVKEDELLDFPSVEAYVMFGNVGVHGRKPLLTRKHRMVRAPWMISRSVEHPFGNVLYVWEKP